MGSVPFPVVVVVAMIIAAFIAGIAANQSKCGNTQEEDETQHVFYCVLHKEWFLKYIDSKILPDAKRGLTGV
jgi:hypothetical protein